MKKACRAAPSPLWQLMTSFARLLSINFSPPQKASKITKDKTLKNRRADNAECRFIVQTSYIFSHFRANFFLLLMCGRKKSFLRHTSHHLWDVKLTIDFFHLFVVQSNKPIMEKRRRARINNCLNELKTLILDAMKKDVSIAEVTRQAPLGNLTVLLLSSSLIIRN